METTQIERGDLFLDAFRRIESHFREALRAANGVPFKQLVTLMRAGGLITDMQVNQLLSFASLRNALSHWPSNEDGAIADPRQSALDALLDLERAVTTPRRVVDVLPQHVVSLTIHDTVGAFLRIVKEDDFSQVPVSDGGKYVGLVTLGALARSVAETIHFDKFNLTKSPIRELLGSVQPEDQFRECPPGVTVPEALNLFDIDEERPARGLIVVERGETDTVYALITYEDLPKLMANV